MADFTALKTAIQTYIKQNGNEEITGDILQEILLSVVTTLGDGAINDLITALGNEVTARQQADGTLQKNITNEATARENADTALQGLINGVKNNIDNGYVYAGIATPSTTPVSGKVFYLALTAGTYTNFGSTVVSQGINILKYNGSAWSLDAFIGIDDTPTPNSPKLVKSGGTFESVMANGSAFDISAHFASGSTLATYANLTAALTALDTLSADYKRGGMSIKFVQSSDNKYVQWRLMSNSFSTTVTDWQGVDEVPTLKSKNLVESNGVLKGISIKEQYTEAKPFTAVIITDNSLKEDTRIIAREILIQDALFEMESGQAPYLQITRVRKQYNSYDMVQINTCSQSGSEGTNVLNFSKGYGTKISDSLEYFEGSEPGYVKSAKVIINWNGLELLDSGTISYVPNGHLLSNILFAEHYGWVQMHNAIPEIQTELDNIQNEVSDVKEEIKDDSVRLDHTYLNPNTGLFGTDLDNWTSSYLKVKGGSRCFFLDNGNITPARWGIFTSMGSDYPTDFITGDTAPITTLEVPSTLDFYWVAISVNKTTTALTISTDKPLVGKIANLEITCKGNGKSVLWLGTSIPASCPYPEYACGVLGYKLYNKSLASSGICIESGYIGNGRDGRDLSETIAEKEARYRPYVENHTITEEQLNLWKSYSWENMIIPYIDGTIARCDIIMFDHGYNDRANMINDIQNWDSISKSLVMADADYNRKTSFVGAFCYLLKKIFTVNPNIRIIIPSYMENQSEEIVRGGKNICKLQELLCDYFGFTFLPVYKYLGFFTNQYLPNTDAYIYLINQEYGTNYVVQNWAGNNPDGNVTAFQYYCPDGTHPSSDRTGRAQSRYKDAMLKLMCKI